MGLGWAHNHDLLLTLVTGSPNTIKVRMDDGGEVFFTETSPGSNLYNADAASTSSIAVDPGSSAARYTLNGLDKSMLVFDDPANTGALPQRQSGPTATSPASRYGKLQKLSTVTGATQFIRQQRRATTTCSCGASGITRLGLDGGHPPDATSKSYIEEYQNGLRSHPIQGAAAPGARRAWQYLDVPLLWVSSRRERQRQVQLPGGRPVTQRGRDRRRDSRRPDHPQESGIYAGRQPITQIIQRIGKFGTDPYLQEMSYAFQPGGQNRTDETTAGKTIQHHFMNGVYQGPQDPAGNRSKEFQQGKYRAFAAEDPNGNLTQLGWSTDGQRLDKVTDALSNKTLLFYDTEGRLSATVDALNQRTTYLYDVTRRHPAWVLLSTTASEIAVNGDMEADTGWTNVGAPTTNERSNAQVDTGSYSRRIVAAAAGQGMESVVWNWTANHTYLVVARVYPVSGVAKMQVTGTTAFDKVSSGAGAWQTLRAVYTHRRRHRQDPAVRPSGGPGFYVDSVHIIDIPACWRWQEFLYDAWRTVSEADIDVANGGILQQTTRSYTPPATAASCKSLPRKTSAGNDQATYTYDSAGRVTKTAGSSFGRCDIAYTVYDPAERGGDHLQLRPRRERFCRRSAALTTRPSDKNRVTLDTTLAGG
jgi:hypothetical protein